MSKRKFKSIGILFLSIIYLSVLCFSSLSFAIIVPNNENIPEGKYYIKNKGSNYFMGGVDYYSIVQTPYNTDTDYQKWEIIYVSNGYYRVRNVYSGYYLTAEDEYSYGEMVKESSLSSSNDAQLWKFNVIRSNVEIEHGEYEITAKNFEGTDLALVGDTYATIYGYPVIQDSYTSDFDYSDEWVLIPCRDATLIGITTTETNHNHTTCLNRMETSLLDDYFDVERITTSNMTAYTVKTYMRTSDFFVLRGDGGYDSLGTYMCLKTSDTTVRLHSWDIYNYNGNNGIDLTDCDVAVFAGCYTANHATQSLPQAARDAGAVQAIGFYNEPGCLLISDWTRCFTQEYVENGNYVESALMNTYYDYGFSTSNILAELYG